MYYNIHIDNIKIDIEQGNHIYSYFYNITIPYI